MWCDRWRWRCLGRNENARGAGCFWMNYRAICCGGRIDLSVDGQSKNHDHKDQNEIPYFFHRITTQNYLLFQLARSELIQRISLPRLFRRLFPSSQCNSHTFLGKSAAFSSEPLFFLLSHQYHQIGDQLFQ